MARNFDVFLSEAPDVLAVHWGWAIALGIGIGVLGILAIMQARVATVIAVRFLGALIFVSAVATLLFAFTVTGYWIDFFVHVIWAFLVAIVGLVLLTRPTLSAEAITLLMSFYFFMEGAAIIGFALSSHIDGQWIYMTQGLMAWLFGALLLFGWPITGLWAIGTFIGIDLLFKGWAIIALGLGLRAISEGPLF
ncbi:hypothetical protein AMST5_03339 [freshwater sediment metagenome]|uniref:Uncharacterized protein n=1 Tax=freshwater sediment metagenome TaxID=556182 RepID=A0AA48M536_9ZZZZ